MSRKNKRKKQKAKMPRRPSKPRCQPKPTEQLVPAVRLPDDPNDFVPQTNQSKLYQLFLQGKDQEACEAIVSVLAFYDTHNYNQINVEARQSINDFVSVVFALMANPNFKIESDQHGFQLVSKSHIFANLVAISTYGTTDGVLAHVMNQQHNFLKLLFLYTSRNSTYIPVKNLFDTNAKYASLWYFTYILPSIGQVSELVHNNVQRHIVEIDDRYTIADFRLTPLYFACTYLNDNNYADHRVKSIINKVAQAVTAKLEIKNTPRRESIAIVTAKWFENSAVYKSSSPLIEKLREKYDLTLIHLGAVRPTAMVTEPFSKVHYLEFRKDGNMPTDVFKDNDYQLVYFPDVGMNNESVWLSNIRWAPIQVSSYGHPVSTCGSEIDYFIVGSESEVLGDLEKNYSERAVVIPGIGAHPSWPNYVAKYPKRERKDGDKVIINCAWGPDKHNYPMYQLMRRISDESKNPIEFHLFCSRGIHRYQSYLIFLAEVKAALPGAVVVHGDKEYFAYMEAMENGDFALNSYPFGGYNTVVESFYLHKPMITLEGDKFYNKAASCLLNKINRPGLIAHTPEEFVQKTIAWIDHPEILEAEVKYLEEIDLRALLFDTDEPKNFEKAIDYLIENHEQLKADGTRKPIFIGAE